MQFKEHEGHGKFDTLFYELTWPICWDQMLSFADVLIHKYFWSGQADGSHPIKVEIGAQAGDKPTDVTDQLAQADFNIYKTDFAAQGAGFLVVTGYAESMHVDMRMSFWTDTNQVLLQLRDDMAIAGSGTPQVYNHFMDALEIWGHITTVKRGMGTEA